MTIARQPGAPPRKRRWFRWPIVLLVTPVLMLALLAAGLVAATSRPSWYNPAAPDLATLRADKAALVEIQEQISAAVNSGRPARVVITEEQLNRWLAARVEIWPDQPLDFGPLVGPQLRLEDGGLRVAATAEYQGWRAVLMLTLTIAADEREIVIRYASPHVGRLPLPRAALTGMGTPLADAGGTLDERRGEVRLPNEWIWPNGKRRCRLRDFQITPGRLEATIEPVTAGDTPAQRP